MRVQIVTADTTLELETRAIWSAAPRPIPCHRCGLCCERWQPLLTAMDADQLAAYLGLSADEFRERFTTPYPLDDERRLLRQEAGRCVFLHSEPDGRTTCTVHPARPQACRDWEPALTKKECVQGLERLAASSGLLRIEDLYPDCDDRRAFARSCRL